MQPVFRVPEGDAVAMEILLPRAVHSELDVHLPVLEKAWLQSGETHAEQIEPQEDSL